MRTWALEILLLLGLVQGDVHASGIAVAVGHQLVTQVQLPARVGVQVLSGSVWLDLRYRGGVDSVSDLKEMITDENRYATLKCPR